MNFRNSTLVFLLVGTLGLTSAHNFPDGPSQQGPGRTERKAFTDTSQKPTVPALETPPIEISIENRPGHPARSSEPDNRPGRPAHIFDSSPVPILLREAHQLIDISDPNKGLIEPQPTEDGSGDKPEPQFDGLHIVPRRKAFTIQRKQASSCQMNYAFTQSGTSATVQSPRYPRVYPNNAQSSLCFRSPDRTQMQVACSDFNLESQRSCLYDYIGLGLSGSPDASSLTKYCGKEAPTATSTGNSLAFVFKSDSSNSGSATQAPYRFSCSITVTESSTPITTIPTPTPVQPDSGSGNCACGQRVTVGKEKYIRLL